MSKPEDFCSVHSIHRNDYKTILNCIEENSRVLDLGCGNGSLLHLLHTEKNAKCYGVELDESKVISCVEKGLSVFQGDLDEGLRDFDDKSFDYVILNQTLPVIHKPYYVMQEMLRVGKKCIVTFPNFAYWKVRLAFFTRGAMPVSENIPYEWYDTPFIHHLTIKDFLILTQRLNTVIWDRFYYNHVSKGPVKTSRCIPNWSSAFAIYVLSNVD